jgi:predicted O-methyltransferase YrrM
MSKLAASPLDPRARAVADRLHARSRRQLGTSLLPQLVSSLRSRIKNGSWDNTQTDDGKRFLSDKLVALDPEKAALCYLLCRSLGAVRVVEAGTSFGVSTIYLAAAVRDNAAASGGVLGDGVEPLVIGTEHEPAKATAAHRNLRAAGVDGYVDILQGDLRETLQDIAGPIDFMLVDIWIPMARPALELVTPHLRPGALVVCDNVLSGYSEYADYLAFVRDPDGPFTSVTIPGQGGMEVSMRRR